MTIDELYKLQEFIEDVYDSQYRSSKKLFEILDLRRIIKREIDLKTTNMTTGKRNELHRNTS